MPAARRPHAGASAARPKPATPSAGKVPKFLRSLYAILQTEDRAIVAWVQNQELAPNRLTAFHILDMARFEREILPKYFKHQKFASFQRQLNNFGFRKWTKTQSSGVCTFSHNCFPPDPARAGVMRASMREQWRQLPPEGDVGADGRPRRRIVGNGITKAKRAAARAEAAAQVDAMATPTAQFKSAATTMGDMFAGLEAFCDGAQVMPIPHQAFLLPPLQPHHLVTPRGSLYAPTAMPVDMEAAPAGSFRQSLVAAMAAKPPLYQPEAVDAAAPHGAFIEPWMWDVHHAGMDLGALPLDADWQENGGSNGSGHGQAAVAPAGMGTRDGPCHSQDRAVPSGVEDFGLENLLFVE